MDLECHTESSKSDREGEMLYDIRPMWNLKRITQMNLQNRNRLTDFENELWLLGEGRGRDS